MALAQHVPYGFVESVVLLKTLHGLSPVAPLPPPVLKGTGLHDETLQIALAV